MRYAVFVFVRESTGEENESISIVFPQVWRESDFTMMTED